MRRKVPNGDELAEMGRRVPARRRRAVSQLGNKLTQSQLLSRVGSGSSRNACEKSGLGSTVSGRRGSETAKELVELVGGVEVGLKFAGGEFFAKIFEAAGEKIERGGKIFLIRKNDVAPGGIGAAGKAERIAKAGTCERDGQTVFVQAVIEKRAESDGGELREMRDESDGVVMLLGAEPEGAGADFLEKLKEGSNARFARGGACLRRQAFADERVGGVAKEVGIGVRDSGEFPARHGMPAQKERASITGKKAGSGFGNAQLGAAGVGDERVKGHVARNLGQEI